MRKTWLCGRFFSDEWAVLGLPMRLTVAVIIGTIALASILGFILNPCLFPTKMIISVDPMSQDITSSITFPCDVLVQDQQGRPVIGAQVLIKGLGAAQSIATDVAGKASFTLTVALSTGTSEGYLDVQVKAPCFETFSQPDMIKIYRTS
jgi:hypothetical protein